VSDIIQAINRETELEVEKMQDERLWSIWVHIYRREGGTRPYGEWKKAALGKEDPKPKAAEIKIGTEDSLAKNLEIANNTLRKIRNSTERR